MVHLNVWSWQVNVDCGQSICDPRGIISVTVHLEHEVADKFRKLLLHDAMSDGPHQVHLCK